MMASLNMPRPGTRFVHRPTSLRGFDGKKTPSVTSRGRPVQRKRRPQTLNSQALKGTGDGADARGTRKLGQKQTPSHKFFKSTAAVVVILVQHSVPA